MPLDSRYFTAIDLEEYFVDRTTGQPLSGGSIYFFEDDNRNTPKAIYTISGAPPNYTYVALPNPLTLSAVGTIQDGLGNNVPIYYFPYNANGDLELYYIVVQDANGVVQFTREAWPNVTPETNPDQIQANISNMLSNPQFSDVLFSEENTFTFTIPGASTGGFYIASDWYMTYSSTDASSINVTRTPVPGNSGLPGNPPYLLTVTPGANLIVLTLDQAFIGNPNIFAPENAGENGWLSVSVLLAPGSSCTFTYDTNTSFQDIATFNNISGLYEQFNRTVQLNDASNPNTPLSGGVTTISLGISTVNSTTLSNIQVVGLESDLGNVAYEQTPINRQNDQLFNYYQPYLLYKPTSSYLVGWDFAYNPAQVYGYTIASGGNADSSCYILDQTILFQSSANGIAVSQDANSRCLELTATNNSRFALVQYLPASEAVQIINGLSSVMVSAYTSQAGGIPCTVSLYYGTGTLPNAGSPPATGQSIVASLNGDGSVATVNGANWHQISRIGTQNGFVAAQGVFTVEQTASSFFNRYTSSFFKSSGSVNLSTVNWIAIVVGFGQLTATQTVTIQSISLVPGNIATIPSIKTQSEILLDCERYYTKSFLQGTVPAQNTGLGTGESYGVASVITANGITVPFNTKYFLSGIPLRTPMYAAPNVTTYNPLAANALARDLQSGADLAGTTVLNISPKYFIVMSTNANAGNPIVIHWAADSRIGL